MFSSNIRSVISYFPDTFLVCRVHLYIIICVELATHFVQEFTQFCNVKIINVFTKTPLKKTEHLVHKSIIKIIIYQHTDAYLYRHIYSK